MGVDVTFFVMYGVKLPYDKDLVNDIQSEDHTDNDIELVVDYMCGSYIVLGNILSSMDEYGGGSEFSEIDLDNLESGAEVYRKKFKSAFPKWGHLVDVPFKVVSFAHYS